MGKASRDKGARGEREAAAYLRSLGIEAERNGRNGYSTDDLRLPGLPMVIIEVKYGYPLTVLDIGRQSLRDAWEQAAKAAGWERFGAVTLTNGSTPCVLWKPPRLRWRLTWMEPCGLVTTCGNDEIKTQLLRLEEGGAE